MSSQVIQLQLINRSNDQNNSEILIFQKNVSTETSETAIAWTVIRNLEQGDRHPFEYPIAVTVGASDAWGNYTPQFSAMPGEAFQMVLTPSGDVLQPYAGGSSSPLQIEVRNDLQTGAINALIYRAGKLAASKTDIAPGQKAAFQFNPTIFVGVVSEVEEGTVLNSAILSEVNTEFSLLGISSADIVMTGGGSGISAEPFVFSLENVVFA